MNLSPHSNALLILCFLLTVTEIHSKNAIHFTSDVSISCGSTGTFSARDGRIWLGDKQPRSLLQLKGLSTTSTAIRTPSSADPVPHRTARISSSRFSYEFHVTSGQKIIRLHFNPSPYKGFKGFRDLFTVQAGNFTLLTNFSASITLGMNTLTKEFCINIRQNQLALTFSPEIRQSLYTYAFINGIEIFSVPAILSYFNGGDVALQVIGKEYLAYVDNDTALEIIHRLNVKQEPGDFDSVFPRWATQQVAKNRSRTWNVPVEVGFRYLIRLHFSEVGLRIARYGDVMFKVLINGVIAQTNSDILKSGDGDSVLLFRDYMVMMRGVKEDGKRDLLISLQSYDELRDVHGVLAGFEVVKMSNHDNSLASPNPLPLVWDSPSLTIRILLSILGNRNPVISVVIFVLSLLNIIVYKLRDMWEASNTEEDVRPSARAEQMCRRFSLVEMQLATRNFSSGLLIGRGGFGLVYKGFIDKGQKMVAVKRSKLNSRQGAREFLAEIEVLSELRHINIISLIGYCTERREMILVYEYMPGGTLSDHLYKLARRGMDFTSLTWKQRLNICIGAGQGLHYLHTGHRVIHRDVKASNILLDEDFEAKVSDFGLAKSEDKDRLKSHVSTKVKGTFGYFDPYYMATQKLTRKTDTYAFGVVLLETLCGRPAVDSTSSEDERILSIWARDKFRKGEANEIVDLKLRDEISLNSLNVFVGVAIKCLEDEPDNRPTMSQVVLQLELALEQQEIRNLAFPLNHTDEVDPDVCLPNEEIISSVSDEISGEAYADVLTATLAPTKQTNSNFFSAGKRDGKKQKTHNPSRFRAWGAFWNRINPIKSIISETRAGGIKLPPNLCRHFSLIDIKTATHKFSENHVIGRGGYAVVYIGVIDGATPVAIKKLISSSYEGTDEFLSEILVMSKLRHLHLVSLIGYCHEKGEMILVCDYMAGGSLANHLYNSIHSPLTWKRRLRICLGAAKGLHYLHTGLEQTIIHRDVKSANILLDENWEAKICDFGESKVCPSGGDDAYVSTVVKGTFGYLDPEFFRSNRLTDKSDVYSFGIMLFEVLCGRRPIESGVPEEQINLASWATFCYGEGTLENIIDCNVKGEIGAECLNEYAGIAVACLRMKGIDRPSMRDVVLSLESAIKFQESPE